VESKHKKHPTALGFSLSADVISYIFSQEAQAKERINKNIKAEICQVAEKIIEAFTESKTQLFFSCR
jgi:hypothetical protein